MSKRWSSDLVVNLQGPYSHGHWQSNDDEILTNDTWVSRSQQIVTQIETELQQTYTPLELSKMTMLDIGCYDGWATNELQRRLGFEEAIGVEPRKKNINKGVVARETLGIKTECKFVQGSLYQLEETLQGRKFDVVVCVGVFHHIYDHLGAIKILRDHCVDSGVCFLETIYLPSLGKRQNRSIRRTIELKDLAYRNQKPIFGITAYKFESGYLDGSTHASGLVGIPSVEQLEMIALISGFSKPEYLIGNKEYSRKIALRHRSFSALLCRMNSNKDRGEYSTSVSESCFQSEMINCGSLLPIKWLVWLENSFVSGDRKSIRCKSIQFVINKKDSNYIAKWLFGRFIHSLNSDQREILINLIFCPEDRTLFEAAKIQIASGEVLTAIDLLDRLVHRRNTDWRCTYRGCLLMAICFDIVGNPVKAKEYREFAQFGQPNLDERLLKSGEANPLGQLLHYGSG